MTDISAVAPTRPGERLVALDVLRGVALLGILLMNIQSFAMPSAAYFNPTAYGDLEGANNWVWTLSHMFADQKFMTIFSMLFGAGVILFTSRLEARGRRPLALHYRRSFWLLMIGLCHAYLFWSGDVLVVYAICAFFVYWFRNRGPRLLVVLGLASLMLPSLFMAGGGATLEHWPDKTIDQLMQDWEPTTSHLELELASYRGGWLEQMPARAAQSAAMHTAALLFWSFWRAGGLMLIGMALYKWGVLSAGRDRAFYSRLAVIGLGIGIPVVAFGVLQNNAHGWEFAYSRFGPGFQFNYWASILVSLGYIALVMAFVMWGGMARLQQALAAVGRTALTNYLLQTLIATTVFYGHGMGWFGAVERTGQLAIVLAIWAAQLIASPIWLRHFRFGPAEWAWRSLTYWRRQPMRLARRNDGVKS